MKEIVELEQDLDQLWSKKRSFLSLKKYMIDQGVPYISSGSSRYVFGPINGHVLKIARNVKGIEQNKIEADGLLDQHDCVCEWFSISDEGIWIESDYCVKVLTSDFKEILGYSFNFYKECLEYIADEMNPYSRHRVDKPEGFEELIEKEDPFLTPVYHMITDFNLPIGDLCRISSYGIDSKGDLVIVDSGLTYEIFQNYYA